MNSSNYSIEDKCIFLKETFDLSIHFINPEGKVIHEDEVGHGPNPLYESQKGKFINPLSLKPSEKFDFPVIKKSVFSEKFILLSVMPDEVFQGTLLIGPSLPFPFSKNVISGIVNDWGDFFSQEEVFRYFNSLPIIKTDKLMNICIFANLLFNDKLISLQSVVMAEFTEDTEENEENQHIDLAVSKNLQSNVFHHDRLFEKRILYIIREGKVEDLRSFPLVKEEEEYNLLSKTSYLRSVKYHIITLITLVSRASIEGGLHEEIAFSLHDRFILQLEEANQLDDVRKLAKEVLYTYTEKVKEVKDERFPRTITLCKDYIFRHIYEEISHEDIARKVELNPKYLSRLFKKEVGMTVNEYIQQSKIDEAKKLLAYSKTPISEICSLLNYNDQSYFTKVFKKVVGVTPKQFREKYHLLKKE